MALRDKNRIIARDRRQEVRDAVLIYKAENGCVDCGEDDPVVLDCHHKDPGTKEHCIGNMIGGNWSLGAVLAELKKCIVLCANCHRRRHAANR